MDQSHMPALFTVCMIDQFSFIYQIDF